MAISYWVPTLMTVSDWQAEGEAQHEALAALARGLLGLAKTDAMTICEDLGLQVRVIDWDLSRGPFALMPNYVGNRVTDWVKDGTVTNTEPG